MKLGQVLRKERERKGLSAETAADHLHVPLADYLAIEDGGSPAEIWGPLLARVAIALETPTSRLLAESGKANDTHHGQAGTLIRRHRERRQRTPQDMASTIDCPIAQYLAIEAGDSAIEVYGPLLLRFAELIEQPVFNLFYPCGLPFAELDDYP